MVVARLGDPIDVYKSKLRLGVAPAWWPCYSSPMTKMNANTRRSMTDAQAARIEAIHAEIAGNGSGNRVTVRKAAKGFLTLTETDKATGDKTTVDIAPDGHATY